MYGPKLDIIIGPMFSGKTSRLVREYRKSKSENKIIINHSIDKRYSDKECISTHDNIKLPAISINNINEILNSELIQYDEFYIDEAQFFKGLYETILELMKLNKKIILFGLDGDFEKKPFYSGDIIKLIPHCNKVEKLNSKCYICNNDAPYTKRLIDYDGQICVGTKLEYQPVCYKHHM